MFEFEKGTVIDQDTIIGQLPIGRYDINFCQFERSPRGKEIETRVLLSSQYLQQGVDFYLKNKPSCLCINRSTAYLNKDLNFLQQYPQIEDIAINGKFADQSMLSCLTNLKNLSLSDDFTGDDLRKFTQLKSFSGFSGKRMIFGAVHENLESLRLWSFPGNDLRELPSMPNLKHLYLVQAKIKTLNGLERFPRLRSLVLGYSRTLIDINALRQSQIKWLEVDSCCKIEDITDVLKNVPSLQGIKLSGKITMPSVDFVRFLPQLRYFYFCDCNVINGDMSPCEGIEFVYFKNKKHFSPKCESFKRPSKSFMTIEDEIIYG